MADCFLQLFKSWETLCKPAIGRLSYFFCNAGLVFVVVLIPYDRKNKTATEILDETKLLNFLKIREPTHTGF